MNSELIIEFDKKVTIKTIKQWETYGGLLEGVPTKRSNKRTIERTKKEAKKITGVHQIFLIETEQKPIEHIKNYVFGTPASLPKITCVAELWYNDVFRDKNKMFSSLCIIWYQEDYAFPIEEHILDAIKEIPFSKICGEFDY